MQFLLQKVNDEVVFDLVFAVRQNIFYQLWRGENIHFKYAELTDIEKSEYHGYIPVGSVEFVEKYCANNCSPGKIRPLNVPKELLEYKKETYMYPEYKPTVDAKWFVKDTEKIKSEINGVYTTEELKKLPNREFQISKMQNIVSEYRCFVNHGELLDCRCYSGDFMIQPNYNLVKEMIRQYDIETPYTLDIFVDFDLKTQVMECHDFWSIGLYGFEHTALCQMVSQGFNKLKRDLLLQ